MHPHQRHQHQHEQQGERARPYPGEVEQRAERQRQDKAAEPADHADQPADRADVVGVIDRDVLEHGRLAEAHEQPEHEDRHKEGDEAHLGVEGDRPAHALDDVGRRRIGEHEGRQHRDAEGDVEHRARAVAVGQLAAVDAEQARRDRIERREHARRLDVEAVDPHEVARQPQRERDERPENEEVIERKAPDLHVLEHCQLRAHRRGSAPLALARDLLGILLGEQEEQHRHREQARRPHLCDGLPAGRDHHERRDELGHRGADVARAEDAKHRALFLRREELRDVGHADRESAACQPDAERGEQQRLVAVGVRGQERGDRGEHHYGGEDPPSADLVGPHAEQDAGERPGQDRGADEEAELGLAQAKLILHPQPDDREDGPHCEAGGEGERASPQHAIGSSCRGGGWSAGYDFGHPALVSWLIPPSR